MKYKRGDKVYVKGRGKREFTICSIIKCDNIYLMTATDDIFVHMKMESHILCKVPDNFSPTRYISKIELK